MRINKSYIGVVILALLVIGRYVYHLWYMDVHYGFEKYRLAFAGFMPYYEIVLRYSLSNTMRIVGIALSVGLLMTSEYCRRFMVYLCWFNILTIYWKHPFQSIYHVAPSIADRFPFPGNWIMSLDLSQEQLTWVWIIVFNLVELIMSGAVLIYLTRPNVKALFTKD